MSIRELKRRIRRTIRKHYGEDLGTFREDANYNEGTAPFVASLVCAVTEQPDKRDPSAPYTRVSAAEKAIWDRLRSMRLEKGKSRADVAHSMEIHESLLEALEEGWLVATIDFILGELKAIGVSREEHNEFVEWMMSDSVWGNGGKDRLGQSGGAPAQSFRGVIEKNYGQHLWLLHPEVDYEESIAPFIDSMIELAVEYHATSRAGLHPIKKSLRKLIERMKTEADASGVHWLVHIARQDEGMADIISRMFEAELAQRKPAYAE